MRESWDGSQDAHQNVQCVLGRASSGAAHDHRCSLHLCQLDARCGVTGWRLHDLRRTVATGMADIGVQPHIIEAVLNHVSGHKGGVAGIYNRANYAAEKAAALARWDEHVSALVRR